MKTQTGLDNDTMHRMLAEGLEYSDAPESDKAVMAWLNVYGRRFSHVIGGVMEVPGTHDKLFDVINPATEEGLAQTKIGTPDDVDRAMRSAERAFKTWSRLSGHKRARYLYAIARAIARHARLFQVLESLNNGKTFREARGDIALVIRWFYYHAGWAQILDEEFPNHKPGGVIGQIIPWNFPLLMAAWKIAPAIAAGNTVVLKVAETTPLTAWLLAQILIEEVELPAGVVNIVLGDGTTGEAVASHPTPWKIAFTGSTAVGQHIRRRTAGSGKKLGLELGGKSPIVALPHADIDSLVEGVVNATFYNKGEVCCAGTRLLVHESIYEEVVDRLKVRMRKLRTGSPQDKAVDIGAMNSQKQCDAVCRYLQIGQDEGGTMWQPEEWTCPSEGFYVAPTLFTDVEPAGTLAREEVFGPVLVIIPFSTPPEGVTLARNTRYGLAASVWTQDIDTALDVARQMRAGVVWVNEGNAFDPATEFGGVGMSGFGREGGRAGMEDVLVENLPFSTNMKLHQPVRRSSIKPPRGRIDRTVRNLIGTGLARPDGETSFQVRSPAGDLIRVIGDANRKDLRNAVDAARTVVVGWENRTPHNRAQILFFLAENLEEQEHRFVRLIQLETGRTRASAQAEFNICLERLFHWAALADKDEGTVQPVPARKLVVSLKKSFGVVGIRAPDVFPLLGIINTVAPAIVAGNVAVVVAGKHPLCAMDFVQVVQCSDVPDGVVNIATAKDPDAAAVLLANHEDVDALWCFDVSDDVRRSVEEASACNLKPTWVMHPGEMDWLGRQGSSRRFLRQATWRQNIWVPFGA